MIMVATAFIFNFYLEVMVDGTEMLNHSEVNVESSKEEEDSKSLNINTLNHKSIEMKHYEMSKEYSKHFSKPYIRAISWGFGGFGALSLGLIGCLELQHAFMLPLPLCLILGGATLLVEQQFMAKQIERFLSKYIFLMLSEHKFNEEFNRYAGVPSTVLGDSNSDASMSKNKRQPEDSNTPGTEKDRADSVRRTSVSPNCSEMNL
tara:strand:- start:283 stop:897 length:615 start_codon:yes stop_codon:yes gene_type:complete